MNKPGACAVALAFLICLGEGHVLGDGAKAPPLTRSVARAQTLPLTIVDATDGKTLGPQPGGIVAFDFGSVKEGSVESLNHSFAVRNDNSTALTLAQLEPACGCTTATMQGGVPLPLLLAPGQSAVFDVSLNMHRLEPGAFDKLLLVKTVDQSLPAAAIRLAGTVEPAVTFSESHIDFGNVAYGEQRTKDLTVTADPSSVPDVAKLTILSSNPDVSLVLKSSAPAPGGAQVFSYVASLTAKPRLGLLTCDLYVRGPSKTGERVTWGAPAHITGNVVGSFGSTPQSLWFELGTPGATWSQDVRIRGIKQENQAKVKIFSASPWILVVVTPPSEP